MNNKVVGRVVVTLAVCGVAVLGIQAAAQAATPSGARTSSSTSAATAAPDAAAYNPGFADEHIASMEAQVPLIELVQQIADQSPSWGAGSLEGSRIDLPTSTIELFWHGAVPEQLGAVIQDAAAEGVTITVATKEFTAQQLQDAAQRILNAGGYVEGLVIGPNVELDGVEVRYPGAEGDASLESYRAAIAGELAATGIPGTIVFSDPVVLTSLPLLGGV